MVVFGIYFLDFLIMLPCSIIFLDEKSGIFSIVPF